MMNKSVIRYTIGWSKESSNFMEPAIRKFKIRSDGWQYKTVIDVRVWCCEAALTADLLTKLCSYEDKTHKGWAEYREKEILQSMLEYQSTQDEEYQFSFAYWWKENGFQKRAQELHV